MRLRRTLVAARNAIEDQGVLAKLIAQFVDMKSARHGANCYGTGAARPSSTHAWQTLYDADANTIARSSRAKQSRTPTRRGLAQRQGCRPDDRRLTQGLHQNGHIGGIARQ
jgi:hypothetical protein